MSAIRPLLEPRFLVWYGAFGAPFAWAVQHVTGFALTQAQCNPAGATWSVPQTGATIAVTAVAALVALGAEIASIRVFTSTKDVTHDGPPPDGRIRFLSIVGMAIAPLFLFMILMSGIGSVVLTSCVQS
jgi:hypothetical protein